MRTGSRWVLASAAVLVLLMMITGIAAWRLAGSFVADANRPVTMPEDFAAVTVAIPGEGRTIAGSWRDLGSSSPVVLLVHGAGGDRRSMLPRARVFIAAGFSTLLIDLQAHGETPGEVITFGQRESADVRAARDWLRRQAPGRRIAAVGASLGAAAILLGPQPAGFDAVVVEAAYPRIEDAIRNRMAARAGVLSVALSPLLQWQLQPRLGVSAHELQPIRSIAHLESPVLIVGGLRDAYTTEQETRTLFAAAREPKRLWLVPGASHQDFSRFDPQGYQANVVAFLQANLQDPPPDGG